MTSNEEGDTAMNGETWQDVSNDYCNWRCNWDEITVTEMRLL